MTWSVIFSLWWWLDLPDLEQLPHLLNFGIHLPVIISLLALPIHTVTHSLQITAISAQMNDSESVRYIHTSCNSYSFLILPTLPKQVGTHSYPVQVQKWLTILRNFFLFAVGMHICSSQYLPFQLYFSLEPLSFPPSTNFFHYSHKVVTQQSESHPSAQE